VVLTYISTTVGFLHKIVTSAWIWTR